MSLQHISTKTEFDDYVKKDAFILLKHSNTCPISAQAYDEFVKFVEDFPDFPAVYIVVQEDRSLSDDIAKTFHVKHESPQIILFNNGNVAYHTSHWNITVGAIQKAIEEL